MCSSCLNFSASFLTEYSFFTIGGVDLLFWSSGGVDLLFWSSTWSSLCWQSWRSFQFLPGLFLLLIIITIINFQKIFKKYKQKEKRKFSITFRNFEGFTAGLPLPLLGLPDPDRGQVWLKGHIRIINSISMPKFVKIPINSPTLSWFWSAYIKVLFQILNLWQEVLTWVICFWQRCDICSSTSPSWNSANNFPMRGFTN